MRLFLSLLLSSFFCVGLSHAQQAPYQPGTHYTVLESPVEVADPSNIQVVEVFWYGCSHCFRFEPLINKWKEDKPADVTFERLPAMWNRLMEMHARMYYAAEQLGVLEQAHQGFFNAMNIHGNMLDDAEAIGDLMAEYGADKEAAMAALSDPEVVKKVKEANARSRRYQITGTPQMIVQGKYLVESNREISQSEMLAIVDFLVAKERAAQ